MATIAQLARYASDNGREPVGSESLLSPWAVPGIAAPSEAQLSALGDQSAWWADRQASVRGNLDTAGVLLRAFALVTLEQINWIRARLPTPAAAITAAQLRDAVVAKAKELGG